MESTNNVYRGYNALRYMQLMLLQVKLQKSVEGTYLVKKETTNKAMRNIFRCFAITKKLSLCFEGQKTA